MTEPSSRGWIATLQMAVRQAGQVLIPGGFAWAVTVLPAASSRLAPRGMLVPALGAIGCLLVGSVLLRSHPRLGRALALWCFVLGAVLSWALNPQSLAVDRLDPVLAASGSVGWLLYGLSWGVPWQHQLAPEDNPRARLDPKLEPRGRVRWGVYASVAIGCAGAFVVMALAWRAREPERALLLQGVALASAVGVISASSAVSQYQGLARSLEPPTHRVRHAAPWLLALAALGVMALAWHLAN